MKPIRISPKVYWVGAIDWDIRDFHGYKTPRGTSYNAYLIVDDEVVLVDTVKRHLMDDMMARIAEVVEPARISKVVVNHVEMDHAGSLADVSRLVPEAQILVSGRGKLGLSRYHDLPREPDTVESGAEIHTGSLTLKFLHTPMVHWPDSMVTYIPEENLLLSNDAFGQHVASDARFDDQLGWGLLAEEAGTYYANIVMPYGDQVNKAMSALNGLDIETIAPSHGVIWRAYIDRIVERYGKWASHETDNRALIVYDTMWGSTHMIAKSLAEGLENASIPVTVRSLKTSHISEVMADLLMSKVVLIGSPTLNNGMLPTVSAFTTYLKGLRPKNRIGIAFGSHGWGGQGAREVDAVIRALDWNVPREPVATQYKPDHNELSEALAVGKMLADLLK